MEHESHREHHNHARQPESQNTEEHHSGHDHGSMIDDYKKRFFTSTALAIPVLALSDMIQHWFGFQIEFAGQSSTETFEATTVEAKLYGKRVSNKKRKDIE